MSNRPIETDYLVIGAGATAMAFVDTLLSESDARVVMVDRYHRPGGHWNHAYPFVRLHQPSAYYGVNSRSLGSGAKDEVGLNRGLMELASGAEVLDYFDQVMNHRFLPSGRVLYYPMSNLEISPDGECTMSSLLSGSSRRIMPKRKIVNATLADSRVPSTHPPAYAVAPGVTCIPLNDLPKIKRPHAGYVVVGSGKTGIDAVLWLLQHHVDPDDITWVVPRDAWYLDRGKLQPNDESFETTLGGIIDQFEAISEATSVANVFQRLEATGQLLRLDPAVEPTVYRCCTVSQAELAELRRITKVVRMGRVQRVDATSITLRHGTIPNDADRLIVDCSASAIVPPHADKIFDGKRINLMMIRTCQPTFSAAVTAYLESHIDGEDEKNALARPVPVPEVPNDWIRMWAVYLGNRVRWSQHAALNGWLMQSRIDSIAVLLRAVRESDTAKQALVARYRASMAPVAAKLPMLMAALS